MRDRLTPREEAALIERMAEIRELLARMEEKMERVVENLDRVADPAGLPRCVESRKRIDFLEERLAGLTGKLWWLAAAAVSAVGSLGLKTVWEAMRR